MRRPPPSTLCAKGSSDGPLAGAGDTGHGLHPDSAAAAGATGQADSIPAPTQSAGERSQKAKRQKRRQRPPRLAEQQQQQQQPESAPPLQRRARRSISDSAAQQGGRHSSSGAEAAHQSLEALSRLPWQQQGGRIGSATHLPNGSRSRNKPEAAGDLSGVAGRSSQQQRGGRTSRATHQRSNSQSGSRAEASAQMLGANGGSQQQQQQRRDGHTVRSTPQQGGPFSDDLAETPARQRGSRPASSLVLSPALLRGAAQLEAELEEACCDSVRGDVAARRLQGDEQWQQHCNEVDLCNKLLCQTLIGTAPGFMQTATCPSSQSNSIKTRLVEMRGGRLGTQGTQIPRAAAQVCRQLAEAGDWERAVQILHTVNEALALSPADVATGAAVLRALCRAQKPSRAAAWALQVLPPEQGLYDMLLHHYRQQRSRNVSPSSLSCLTDMPGSDRAHAPILFICRMTGWVPHHDAA